MMNFIKWDYLKEEEIERCRGEGAGEKREKEKMEGSG